MNQWTQGYCLTKKTRGRKSRATVPLMNCIISIVQKKGLIVDVNVCLICRETVREMREREMQTQWMCRQCAKIWNWFNGKLIASPLEPDQVALYEGPLSWGWLKFEVEYRGISWELYFLIRRNPFWKVLNKACGDACLTESCVQPIINRKWKRKWL
jgi:hypothetical protein